MTLKQKIRQYRDYIGSGSLDEFNGIQIMLQNRGQAVSSYLDLKYKGIKTPLTDDEVPRYACNHPYDLLASICTYDNNVYLNEALLDTWPSNKVIELFKQTCKKVLSQQLQSITFSQLYSKSNYSGKIIDHYAFGPNGDSLIVFSTPYFIQEGSDKIVKEFTDALYVSGYLLSFSENAKLTDKMKELGIGLCLMQFEARYSRKVFNFSTYLYHVSPSRYFAKIAKHGLTPKSGSQIYKYPERVYLFNQTSVSFAKDFGVIKQMQLLEKNQQDWVDDSTFVVYAIESKKLLNHPLYKSKKMVFYIDPCYDGRVGGVQVCEAIYTYSHIPLELIESRCFVYDLHNDQGKISAKLKNLNQIH